MRKKAIELIRVSTEGQAADDRGGIPAQRAANRQTAKTHCLEIVRTFQIQDVSGSKVLTTPEMQELLRLIESPEIVGVVAKEFSRLMRPEDLADFAILQRFIDTRTVLYLPDGPVDLCNKSGRLFGVIKAAFAGYERTEILERMNSGKEAIRRNGRHACGPNQLPYGIGYDKGTWFYKPEAEKIKEAFRQVLTTPRPYAHIASDLGLPRTNLRCILSNPIWTGWRVYDSRRDPSAAGYVAGENGRQGWRRKIARAAEEVIRVKVLPGIISEQDFKRVQEIFADRAARERKVRTKNEPHYLFNGFLACALCGDPLYTHRNRRACYYICRRNGTRARKRGEGCDNPYILAPKTEAKIETVLLERLQDRDALESIAESYLESSQRPVGVADMDLEATKDLIASLEAKRTRILDGFFEGVISKPERVKRLKAVDNELARLYNLTSNAIEPPAPILTADQLAAVLEVFAEFRFLNRDQKRSILATSRTKVFMDGYTIDRLEMAPPFNCATPLDNSYTDGHFPKVGA